MIRLNLSNRPEWLDLLPGLRVLVAPLTTALMVSARADPAIDGLSETSSQEDMALAMAKAVARRAVLDWEGVGDNEPPRVYRRAKLSENCPLWNRHRRRRPRSRIHLSSANVRCGWRWNIAMSIKARLRR